MTNKPRQVYIIDLTNEIEEFQHYHGNYANQIATPQQQEAYIYATIEQMMAHFNHRDIAVQSFIEHYSALIFEMKSTEYRFHPLRYLKSLTPEECRSYVYCLYGLASRVCGALEAQGLFSVDGYLKASWQHMELNVLYLIDRPEVSHVIFS